MKTNNSYLKHSLKILAQSEGVTVEAREKAYTYVEKYIEKLLIENDELREDIDGLAAELKEAHDTISAQAKQCGELKKEIEKLRGAEEAPKTKAPVKKKTQAKKTVSK